MDGVYKELDEAKAELERVREVCRIKTELSNSLRIAHTDLLAKLQDAKLQIEKQTRELNVKSEEIAEVRQLYDDVKFRLQEKELSLKHVNSLNENIRTDCDEKVQNLEGDNKKLVLELEEATTRNDDLERELCVCREEIGGLKRLLSDSQRKCSEVEQKAQAARELRQRDDIISRLEEQSMSFRDQLKWKKEQFMHLEDAHKQLQDQFCSSKVEWANERSTLLEEISMLQNRLDAQIRMTESLQTQLKVCNQALSHGESRRKMLEVQLSESKERFENVLVEFLETKAKVESLSMKRDEEIAALRSSLGMKEMLIKEMEYRITRLEQDNQELLGSVKELQESQINKRKADPLLTKFRNKLKDLEQVHSNCSVKLNEKEAEWNLKMEKMIGDINSYASDLKRQNEQIQELQLQLESCHFSMEVSSVEIAILLVLLKSELIEAHSKMFSIEAQIKSSTRGREEKIPAFTEQLEIGQSSLPKFQILLEQAQKEIASLKQKLELLKSFEGRNTILENELEKHKQLIEESTCNQLRLREQITQMEVALKDASDSLETSSSEFAAKIKEANWAEAELQIWKSKAESLKTCLEQSQEVSKRMEEFVLEKVETEKLLRNENESLICRLKECDREIKDLQQKIADQDQLLINVEGITTATKLELAEAQRKEEQHLQIIKEKHLMIDNLQKQITQVEQESMRRQSLVVEFARSELGKMFEQENEKLGVIVREKDQVIEELQRSVLSLDHVLIDTIKSSFSEIIVKLVETNALREAKEKTEDMMKMEIEEKNRLNSQLEEKLYHLHHKTAYYEKSLSESKQTARELEALQEDRKREMEKLKDKYAEGKTEFEKVVKGLDYAKEAGLEELKKLSKERDNLLIYINGICEQIGIFCGEDLELMNMFGQIMQNSEEVDELSFNMTMINNVHDPLQKDVILSCKTKEIESNTGKRSPLREINQ